MNKWIIVTAMLSLGCVKANALSQAVDQGKEEGLSEAFIKTMYEDIHKESIRQQEALKK